MLLEKRVAPFLDSIAADAQRLDRQYDLLVGVSGGPDSLALLHLLPRLLGPDRLLAAHLNHGLRPSAAAEAAFVAETAAGWGITCVVEAADVAAQARQQGLTQEEAGRDARYQFFARQAAKAGVPTVAVAHHADDQAETVLMHIIRGTGLAGLRGMLPVAPLPGAPHLKLIRPFLQVSRAEIEAYCRQHQLRPVADPSNQDTTYFRNWLRHELLPMMEQYNPQIRRRLGNTADLVTADYAFFQDQLLQYWSQLLLQQGADWLALDPDRWPALPLSLKRALLRHAVSQLRPALRDVSFRTIENARQLIDSGQAGAQCALPAGLRLTVGYRQITIAGPAAFPHDAPQLAGPSPLPLPVPGRIDLERGWCIEASYVESAEMSQIRQNPDPWVAYVDPGDETLQVRPRQPGERFQPLGMAGNSSSVKAVMINRQVDARLRPAWPLVAVPAHLVWLVGHHIDHRAKVTAASRRVVRLHCHPVGANR